ncbi:substrate-binding domain-containing protein [Marinilabiliaceae bacterium ANBcel2]|nr:substrate-binding domain-containing protein [Marinilabiliaceae bacterium ANBcel2]
MKSKNLIKVKNSVALSLLLIFISLLSSCGNSEEMNIAFLYSTDETERFVIESQFFADRARELGANVVVDHAGNNDAVQQQKAEEMIQDGIDLLVLIYINENTANAIVREAKRAGVKVMAFNRLLNNSDLDMFISANNYNMGEAFVNYTVEKVPRGNYIIFGGDMFDRNAVELMDAVERNLEPHIESGDIDILYRSFTEDWSGANAAFALRQFLNNSNEHPDVIISAFDGMSSAMLDVLQDFNLDGEVIITGQDALIESIHNIREGKQHITMYHPHIEIAHTAAEAAVAMLQGDNLEEFNITYTDNQYKDVPTIMINSVAVTIDNIDEALIEQGHYTREDIYN